MVARVLKSLIHIARDYVQTFWWEEQEAGFFIWGDFWRAGAWGRATGLLILLGFLGVGLALLLFPRADFAASLRQPAAAPVLLLLTTYAWMLVFAEATFLHPLLRFLLGAHSLWYLAFPLFTLPRLWVLMPMWTLYAYEVWRSRRGHDNRYGLLLAFWLWGLMLGRISGRFPFLPYLLSLLLWSLLYLALGLLLCRLARRAPATVRGERWLLWAALTLPYLPSLWSDPVALADNLAFSYHNLWGLTVLLWLWFGGDLVDEGGKLGQFLSRAIGGGFRYRLPLLVGSLALALAGLFGTLVWTVPMENLRHLPPWLVIPLGQHVLIPFLQWSQVVSPDIHFTTVYAAPLALVFGLVGFVQTLRLPTPERRRAFGVTYLSAGVMLGAFILALWQSSFGLEGEAPAAWWPFLLLAVGLLWEETKGLREFTTTAPQLSVLYIGLGLLVLVMTTVQLATDADTVVQYTSLFPLLGAVWWGSAYLIYRLAWGWHEGFPAVRFFVTGYLVAMVPAILWPNVTSPSPALGLLLGGPLLHRWRLYPAASPWWPHRFLAGMLLAFGVLAHYFAPLLSQVPFVPELLPYLERATLRLVATAPFFLSRAQLLLTLGALLAGAIFALGKGGRGWRGYLPWLLAAVFMAAWNSFIVKP